MDVLMLDLELLTLSNPSHSRALPTGPPDYLTNDKLRKESLSGSAYVSMPKSYKDIYLS